MITKKTGDAHKKHEPKKGERRIIPTVSFVTQEGHILELVYDTIKQQAFFAHWDGHKARRLDTFSPNSQTRLVPLKGAEALVRHDVVRFASTPAEYGDTQELVDAIRSYLHRYVDLPEDFERLAARYVLLTWVHDRFNELPYLRKRGDYGSGKTRFMLVLGSICYKPIFAGGASTVSPLFHLLDKIGGTLLIDEADYRFSDENAQTAKILNCGNVRGFSVLRSESVNGKEFRPRAFKVFGPKIVAMRGRYDDPALESRFLTDTRSNKPLRKDIPINLPNTQETEAAVLRNKLLMYRFRNFNKTLQPKSVDMPALEPRLQQILSPILSVTKNETDREAILNHAQNAQTSINQNRGMSLEAEVLGIIRLAMEEEAAAGVSMRNLAVLYNKAHCRDTARPISAKSMGSIVRTRLNLSPRKSHGVFVIPKSEAGALRHLFERYSVDDEDVQRLRETLGMHLRVDYGDVGDLPAR